MALRKLRLINQAFALPYHYSYDLHRWYWYWYIRVCLCMVVLACDTIKLGSAAPIGKNAWTCQETQGEQECRRSKDPRFCYFDDVFMYYRSCYYLCNGAITGSYLGDECLLHCFDCIEAYCSLPLPRTYVTPTKPPSLSASSCGPTTTFSSVAIVESTEAQDVLNSTIYKQSAGPKGVPSPNPLEEVDMPLTNETLGYTAGPHFKPMGDADLPNTNNTNDTLKYAASPYCKQMKEDEMMSTLYRHEPAQSTATLSHEPSGKHAMQNTTLGIMEDYGHNRTKLNNAESSIWKAAFISAIIVCLGLILLLLFLYCKFKANRDGNASIFTLCMPNYPLQIIRQVLPMTQYPLPGTASSGASGPGTASSGASGPCTESSGAPGADAATSGASGPGTASSASTTSSPTPLDTHPTHSFSTQPIGFGPDSEYKQPVEATEIEPDSKLSKNSGDVT